MQTIEQWGDFAQEWRNSYLKFTRESASNPDLVWKTVDQHHEDSLHDLLASHGLADGFTTSQVHELSLIWHRLEPWSDTNAGLKLLNELGIQTCTLSNGNMALLEDMCRHGGMPFTHILSAELFHSYKPNGKVYLGAAARMGFEPEECAMVAAHLEDLRAAKSFGLQTICVERPREERYPELGREGFVDVWVTADEDGFVTVAKRLESQRT